MMKNNILLCILTSVLGVALGCGGVLLLVLLDDGEGQENGTVLLDDDSSPTLGPSRNPSPGPTATRGVPTLAPIISEPPLSGEDPTALPATTMTTEGPPDNGTEPLDDDDDNAVAIRRVVTSVVGEEVLQDPASPYAKALAWILDEDPFFLSSSSPEEPGNVRWRSLMESDVQQQQDEAALLQRFIMVYFYFVTTVEKPWRSCNPPIATLGRTDQCAFEGLVSIRPILYTQEQAIRWLSNNRECEWAGVLCNEAFEVRSITLGKYDTLYRNAYNLRWHKMANGGSLTSSNVLQNRWSQHDGLVSGRDCLLAVSTRLYCAIKCIERDATVDNIQQNGALDGIRRAEGNQFVGEIPEGLWTATNLNRVDLSNNRLHGRISPDIVSLSDLRSISLSGNSFTGPIPSEIGQLGNLTTLKLDDNALTGDIPSHLAPLRSLEELWLSNNNLSGDVGRLGLEAMPNMRDLRLRRNALVHGRFPDEFWKLTTPRFIDIRECNVSGSIGMGVGNMDELVVLRVSGTRFDGMIPTEIANLPYLQSLWIQFTDMTGPVPSEVCAAHNSQVFSELVADCLGTDPDMPCNCCTGCCDDSICQLVTV